MATSIQLHNNTKQKLDLLKTKYESQLKKKLSYDEIINLILDQGVDSPNTKKELIDSLFGVLKSGTTAFKKLRLEGERRSEILSQSNRK